MFSLHVIFRPGTLRVAAAILAVAVAWAAGAPQFARADILAHWSFDETSGVAVADSSGSGKNGTLQNAGGTLAAPGVFGGPNGGISLSNGNDYVAVPRLEMSKTSFTIAAHVDPASLQNGDEVFGDWSNPWQFRLYLNAGGDLHADLRRDGPASNNGNVIGIGTPGGAVDATPGFQHVALTWDRDNGVAYLYVDGNEAARAVQSGSVLDLKDGNHAEYQIGWKRDGGNFFHGGMDELWVFNRPLNVAEIQQLQTQNSAEPIKLVDLADIVGGGDGSLPGTGTATGIDAANGDVGQGAEPGNHNPASPGDYYSVAYDAVDGVFVPNGTIGAQQVTSTGLTFDFAGNSDADPSYANWFNGVGAINDPSDAGGLTRNFSGDPVAHSLLSGHAQKGITFDLDEIRDAHNGYRIDRFTAVAGDSRPKAGGLIDYFVLLDGNVVASGLDLVNTEQLVDVAIHPNNRFLTLVTTNSGNTNNSDHAYFGDAFLHLSVPEPGSLGLAALGLLGLIGLARRRRRQ